MTNSFEMLNENQLEAVKWDDGPLLVLAGPGSGKTKVLTNRIARLIQENPDKFFKILALTFTNKAAGEMRDRIDDLLLVGRERVLLTTFHSFCADLLRQHGHHVGLKPDFSILPNSADQINLLKEVIESINQCREEQSLRAIDYAPENLMPAIERLLEKNIDPEGVLDFLNQRQVNEADMLAEIYKGYRAYMIEKGFLDYSALVAEALSLLKNNLAVKKQITKIYSYICVDEFQDTNELQYELLCHLVNAKTKNLFVVADDDQVIYQWNGADPLRLTQLRENFGMETIQLPENYRCPPEVIDVANKLITYNYNRDPGKKPLLAKKSPSLQGAITVKKFSSFQEEVNGIISDLQNVPEKELGNYVILSRARKLLEICSQALLANGIEANVMVKKDEFSSAAMQWLHSILKLANNRKDEGQLKKLCQATSYILQIDLVPKDMITRSYTEENDLLRTWYESLKRHDISDSTRAYLDDAFPSLLEKLEFEGFIKKTFEWIESKTLFAASLDGEDAEYPDEKKTWESLCREIYAEAGQKNISLYVLLQGMDLRSKAAPPKKNSVKCLTIHASKGMEFKNVYLIGMVEDQLPSWTAVKRGPTSPEMQEERRSCFVAITRAQEKLTLTYSEEMYNWPKKPSRFLKEMGLI